MIVKKILNWKNKHNKSLKDFKITQENLKEIIDSYEIDFFYKKTNDGINY